MTKLLVVDDEPSVRKLIKRFFESRGFEVAVAENGIQGWQMTRDYGPDVVLSDVSMPEMDGYELTRTIRRNPQTAAVAVILLSAHRDADAMVAGYECGADDYVPKPVDMEVLRHKIDALMRRAVASHAQPMSGPTTGKLICVTSAKGGVGVSTLCANLAILLCRRNETVCAYDLNLEHGDLPVLLDLQPKLSIVDLIRELAAQGDNVPWDEFLVRHPSGPRMLAAPLRPHDASAVSEEQVDGLTAKLRELHDFVLVDLPPSYGDLALSVFDHADRLVVVTSPELTSLRRTRELLGVLSGLEIPDERVLVVLNRVIDVAGIDARRIESFFKRPVNL
ncbi:MAG TPA: response regulator, partial [Candidatus Dormibacteraeota bacterium]